MFWVELITIVVFLWILRNFPKHTFYRTPPSECSCIEHSIKSTCKETFLVRVILGFVQKKCCDISCFKNYLLYLFTLTDSSCSHTRIFSGSVPRNFDEMYVLFGYAYSGSMCKVFTCFSLIFTYLPNVWFSSEKATQIFSEKWHFWNVRKTGSKSSSKSSMIPWYDW